jgi:hypothetical protein
LRPVFQNGIIRPLLKDFIERFAPLVAVECPVSASFAHQYSTWLGSGINVPILSAAHRLIFSKYSSISTVVKPFVLLTVSGLFSSPGTRRKSIFIAA